MSQLKSKYSMMYLNKPYDANRAHQSVLTDWAEVKDADGQEVTFRGSTTGRTYEVVKAIQSFTGFGTDRRPLDEPLQMVTTCKELGAQVVSGRFWVPFEDRDEGGDTLYFVLVASQELATQEVVDEVDEKVRQLSDTIQEGKAKLADKVKRARGRAPAGLLEDVEDGIDF